MVGFYYNITKKTADVVASVTINADGTLFYTRQARMLGVREVRSKENGGRLLD